jgi:hypothetical protein
MPLPPGYLMMMKLRRSMRMMTVTTMMMMITIVSQSKPNAVNEQLSYLMFQILYHLKMTNIG